MTDSTTTTALAEPATTPGSTRNVAPPAPMSGALQIPVHLVAPNPWNRQVNAARLVEMTDSVRRHGVLQPVLVRPVDDPEAAARAGQPLYQLVAGERRWRASIAADLPTVPALVRLMDDLEVIELMLVENLQREDLHPLDEAAGYDRLLRKDHGAQALHGFASVEALAERLGKSRSYVVQRLTLLKLCTQGVDAFRAGTLSFSLALRIARLPNTPDQAKATKAITTGWGGEPMSARQADEYIQREFMLALDRAEFKITDSSLLPEAGDCRACPKRTGASPDLFDDIKKGDTCTDGICYQAKQDAHRARVREHAEASGMTVITGLQAKKLQPQQHSQPKGLLQLDKVHYNIDGNKPLRKLLGKSDIQPVWFEDPYTKELAEYIDEGQAIAALKAVGVIKTDRLPGSNASQREDDAKRKAESAWRAAVAEACITAAGTDAGNGPQYRQQLLTRAAIVLWHELHNDTRVRLGKLLGWPPLKSRWDVGPGTTADQHISALTDRELCQYLTATAIVGESFVGPNMTAPKPIGLLDTAQLLGVDAEGIKDSLRKLQRVPKAKGKMPATTSAEATPETALAAALKQAAGGNNKRSKMAVKYRCRDTGSTWSGRGLQPVWLKVALDSGKTLADFDVQASLA